MKLFVAPSKIAQGGRGVFARSGIKKGEVVETCPFIEISQKEAERSVLINYIILVGKDRAALALGYGSLYNHSESPNARFKINEKDKEIVFTAIREINKDEEITFDYGGGEQRNPLWFEV